MPRRLKAPSPPGTYEAGLETIRAESLLITQRRTIAMHAASGAETRLYEVARRDRNQPLSLHDALEFARDRRAILLANSHSHRAAVQLPAASLTLDDGTVERRVRLVRPMERPTMPVDALADTHWTKIDAKTFGRLWTQELEQVPEFTESRFHVVTGLLLSVWKRLPPKNPRVYRFETDDGERVIGRVIPPESLDEFTAPARPLSRDDVWAALNGGRNFHLAGGLALRRATVMHAARIELTGFSAEAVPALKALGMTSEIISWRLRLFLPVSDEGPVMLGKLLHSHPIIAAPAPGA